MKHTVYKITNTINNKYYIGKHSTTDCNDDYFGSGKALKLAIKKHGIDKFKKEILYEFDNELDAYNKENEILNEIDGVNDPNCYNMCYGGYGFWKGSRHSEDSKRKISEGNTGKTRSDEAKEKYRQVALNRTISNKTKEKLSRINKGKTHTKETKKKISNCLKGMKHTEETKQKISIAHKGRISPLKGKKRSKSFCEKVSKGRTGINFTKEHRDNISKVTSGENNPNFGTRWMNNGTKNKKINGTDPLPDGWVYGRLVSHIKGFGKGG